MDTLRLPHSALIIGNGVSSDIFFCIFCGIRPLTTKRIGSTHTNLCLYPGTSILVCLTALRSGFLDKLSGKLTVSWNHSIPCSIKKMLAQPSGEVISSTEHSK